MTNERSNGYAEGRESLRWAVEKAERLEADLEQGSKDYCALMDRHDEQHVTIERLRDTLIEIRDARPGEGHDMASLQELAGEALATKQQEKDDG